MTEPETKFVRIRDIVAATGVSRKTVAAWIEAGEIPGRKIGGQYFVRRDDFEALFGNE